MTIRRGARVATVLAAFALLAGLAGCSNLAYYAQSVGGQLEIFRKERPVADWLADPATGERLRQRLERSRQIRDFASAVLGLPENGSYRKYADLGRPYVVWNVFSAEVFSVKARQSCFLIAGCVGYRGYFARADADRHAELLRGEGHDVYVAGIPAYSTIGWFDDPLLNTFIHYPDVELARLIFHELAHQVVYVKDDSMFNESFAVAVELEGIARWLAQSGTDADRRQFDAGRQRRSGFVALVAKYRDRLEALYAGPLPDAGKREEKARALREMQAEYRTLKAQAWGGFAGYDPWIEQANNAMIASIGIYTAHVPAFRALLAREGGDLPRFYAAVRALAREPRAVRDARLAELAAGAPARARGEAAPLL